MCTYAINCPFFSPVKVGLRRWNDLTDFKEYKPVISFLIQQFSHNLSPLKKKKKKKLHAVGSLGQVIPIEWMAVFSLHSFPS